MEKVFVTKFTFVRSFAGVSLTFTKYIQKIVEPKLSSLGNSGNTFMWRLRCDDVVNLLEHTLHE